MTNIRSSLFFRVMFVASILSAIACVFGNGGPPSHFSTVMKRVLVEQMIQIMGKVTKIMTTLDISMTRTTLSSPDAPSVQGAGWEESSLGRPMETYDGSLGGRITPKTHDGRGL